MSLRIKALSLGLMAALAVSAVAVMGASAETGGHFSSATAHTILKGSDEKTDQTEFTGIAEVKCSEATYHGTTTKTIETEITITPTYNGCTYGSEPATVSMNGCHYKFTIGNSPASQHNTTHLECSGTEGPTITISPGFGHCTITITPDQTPAGGVIYTNIANGDITVDVTVQEVHSVYNGGFFACGVGNGHTTNSELHGSAIMAGTDTEGNPVNISSTG